MDCDSVNICVQVSVWICGYIFSSVYIYIPECGIEGSCGNCALLFEIGRKSASLFSTVSVLLPPPDYFLHVLGTSVFFSGMWASLLWS